MYSSYHGNKWPLNKASFSILLKIEKTGIFQKIHNDFHEKPGGFNENNAIYLNISMSSIDNRKKTGWGNQDLKVKVKVPKTDFSKRAKKYIFV